MNEDNYLLIKFEYPWADEFDVKSLQVITENEWELLKINAEDRLSQQSIIIYFGTNEFIEIQNYDDFTKSFTIIPITEKFYNDFKKFIGEEEFGQTMVFEVLKVLKDL